MKDQRMVWGCVWLQERLSSPPESNTFPRFGKGVWGAPVWLYHYRPQKITKIIDFVFPVFLIMCSIFLFSTNTMLLSLMPCFLFHCELYSTFSSVFAHLEASLHLFNHTKYYHDQLGLTSGYKTNLIHLLTTVINNVLFLRHNHFR